MIQETVYVTDLRQDTAQTGGFETVHYTEMRQDRLQVGEETRESVGNWRQQCRMQIEDKTRYRQERQ
jgi:hypothetical protein